MENPNYESMVGLDNQPIIRRVVTQHLLDHCIITRYQEKYGRPEPGINSWPYTGNTLRDTLKKSCNLKRLLVFYPYSWPYGMK